MPLKVTVGIATWNRCDLLRQTLESMTNLRIPADITWEILVCDNNSTDQTRSVVEQMKHLLPVQYLFEGRQGKTYALNRIADQASGDWLFYTDDDVLVDPDWIVAYCEAVRRYPDAAIFGGQVLPWLTKPVRGRSAYLLRAFPWVNAVLKFDQDMPILNKGGYMPYGPNMAVRTDLLRHHRFDDTSTMKGRQRGAEDFELVDRFLRLGYTGRLIAASRVSHYIPANRVGFKWWRKWHLGAGEFWIKEKGPAPPASFLGLRPWLWRLTLVRLCQAVLRWRPGNPRKSYEALADLLMQIGYVKTSDRLRREVNA